jgi:DNA-binding NarL/FixJ family response regulator
MNIFIADDHQLIIEAYKAFLITSKFENKVHFIESNSCEEAYLKINNAKELDIKIDLAIIDYKMPVYREKDILNGADVCKYLKTVHPNCKTIILTSIIENLFLFDIVQNIAPDGIATKSDVNGNIFLDIIDNVMSGNKYRSPFVMKQLDEVWENEVFIKEKNRIILQYLSKGYRISEIANELSVSEITVKKRLSKIRQSFELKEDGNILKEAKTRGYI